MLSLVLVDGFICCVDCSLIPPPDVECGTVNTQKLEFSANLTSV